MSLPPAFFHQDAQQLAQALLGKILRHRVDGLWLSARIIETEAYYLNERGSHASLGETPSRRALFMSPGHVYMYYARGGDSINFSAQGAGNAVLIKSGLAWRDVLCGDDALHRMQYNNPRRDGSARPLERLCAGQTLLCKSLGLRVPEWNACLPNPDVLRIDAAGPAQGGILQARRLGIPTGRDEHLPYRFIEAAYAACCTLNPLRRGQREGLDYHWISVETPAHGMAGYF